MSGAVAKETDRRLCRTLVRTRAAAFISPDSMLVIFRRRSTVGSAYSYTRVPLVRNVPILVQHPLARCSHGQKIGLRLIRNAATRGVFRYSASTARTVVRSLCAGASKLPRYERWLRQR